MARTISAVSPRAGVVRTLDDLAALGADECSKLYANGATPRVPDLDGDLVGRMLVVPWAWRFVAGPLRAWARSRFSRRTRFYDDRDVVALICRSNPFGVVVW